MTCFTMVQLHDLDAFVCHFFHFIFNLGVFELLLLDHFEAIA